MGAVESFLHAIPKVELHCHLLGSVRRETFTEWVHESGAPITDDEIAAFWTRGEKPVGVLRVLRALDQWLIREPAHLGRLVAEYLEDAAAHQVRHAEFFWNPTGTARDGRIAYAAALPSIVEAMHEAERRHGIGSRLVPAIDREASPRDALEMVQWVVDHPHPLVAGIGIDYREVDRPPELFAEAYALARRHGLKTTAHAGEFGMPWTNVRTAVELLQVDRIDHGYTVVDEPAYAARCAERGLVFTVVPTNSYYLRTLPRERWAQDHPIRAMRALGLKVHPNTDDPTLHHVTPTGCWTMMQRDFGYTLDDLRRCMAHGIDAAWVDDGTKRAWHAEFGAAYDTLRAAHGLKEMT